MHYSNHKVAILGFGVEGQDAARYFLGQKSKKIAVFDKNSKDVLPAEGYEKDGVEFICGPDYLKDGIKDFDLVVRSPGFYRYSPEILEAEEKGAKIASNTQLFFEESEANIIGITGTKGKGTTAQMLKLGLEAGGKKVLLLGNIGVPMLDRIEDADTFDWVILELSSFQLVDLSVSPPIAVVTNITTDHLNWHKDRDEYVHSKENLWKFQKPTDWVVMNYDDETSRKFAESVSGQVAWLATQSVVEDGVYRAENNIHVGEDVVGNTHDLLVPGEHNLANALAALSVAKILAIDPKIAWKGISTFSGSEHRMEEVPTKNGVTYINDSAATTPEAAIAALQSFKEPKFLIAGGSLKGVTFEKFAKAIAENNVKAVFLIGESKGEIDAELKKIGYQGEIFMDLEDMESIVKKAGELAEDGDLVLLSPACASFGIFKDYKDRGEQFKKAVYSLASSRGV